MTYETAKKLKDSGFKCQHQMDMDSGSWCVNCPYDKANPETKGFDDMCYPTLEELIEACKNELDEIIIYITYNLTEVQGINPTYGYDLSVEGSTPEEAVSNLYLELNKK